MKILGIENRTENWRTVEHFHGLSNDAKTRLVQKLTNKLPLGEVKLELFWKGFRDYVHQTETGNIPSPGTVAQIYTSVFPDLRERIKDFRLENPVRKFAQLKPHNYDASPSNRATLFSNLEKTEIDIVLETEDCILIGEAKHESKLKGEGKLILVHQLIRQYVMARILVDHKREKKEVVPFVVVDHRNYDSVMNTAQVGFMTSQDVMPPDGTGRKWMSENNVLTWKQISELWPRP